MEVLKAKSEIDAAETAGESINEFFRDNTKTPILFLLSGGSALKILDFIDESLLNENLTITVLDERYTQNMDENNFAQMEKTSFFELAMESGVNFIGTLPRPNEALNEMSTRFENSLKTWVQENPNGKIIAALGMGEDGHTAGIFKNEDAEKFKQLFDSEKWVVGYDNLGQKLPRERITTTFTFFEKIDLGIIFVCGERKKNALDGFFKKQKSINLLPALGWEKIKYTKLVTDIK